MIPKLDSVDTNKLYAHQTAHNKATRALHEYYDPTPKVQRGSRLVGAVKRFFGSFLNNKNFKRKGGLHV